MSTLIWLAQRSSHGTSLPLHDHCCSCARHFEVATNTLVACTGSPCTFVQLPMPWVGTSASVWFGVASTAAQWCPVNPGWWKMFSHPATFRAVVWHAFEETQSLGKAIPTAFSQLLAVIVCWETFTNGCVSLKAWRIFSLLDCNEQLVTPKFQAAHTGLRCSFCPMSI